MNLLKLFQRLRAAWRRQTSFQFRGWSQLIMVPTVVDSFVARSPPIYAPRFAMGLLMFSMS
jgi:hypothetical protein